jgi:hypothetical protein
VVGNDDGRTDGEATMTTDGDPGMVTTVTIDGTKVAGTTIGDDQVDG